MPLLTSNVRIKPDNQNKSVNEMSKLKQCALCQNTRELKDSHLIPKFIYKIIRHNQPYINENKKIPMVVDHRLGNIQKSCRQEKEFLLCTACEGRFQNNEKSISVIIKSIQKMENHSKTNLCYLNKDSYEVPNQEFNMFFTPENTDQLTYFTISYIYRQLVSVRLGNSSITNEVLLDMREYLLS